MRRLATILLCLLCSAPVLAQTPPSNYPLASLPLNGADAVLLDQGSGCATHVQPCTTVQSPSIRVGQPLVQATAPSTPFPLQIWWDTSTNPAQYKVYTGSAWIAVYQADTVNNIPSFPGNVYLPSGNLGIGTTTVVPNWPITIFATNTVSNTQGVTLNAYESSTGTVGSVFRGFSVRGSLLSPSAVQANDVLTALYGSGYWTGKVNGYAIGGEQRASVQMQAAENWSSVNNNGAFIAFLTTPTGSNVTSESARVDSTGNFGVGTTSPSFGFTLTAANPIPSGGITQGYTVNTRENGTGLTGSGFRGFSARGTLGSPTSLNTNDPLVVFSGSGFWTGKTNAFWSTVDGRAQIGFFAAENWVGANNNGSYITFSTTNNGAGSMSERLRLNATGGLGLGTATDPGANNLLVTGSVQLGSSSNLTLAAGELGFAKTTASGSAPTAAGGKMALVCGTNAGTAKLISYAGTSTTPSTILDNIGGGVSGC